MGAAYLLEGRRLFVIGEGGMWMGLTGDDFVRMDFVLEIGEAGKANEACLLTCARVRGLRRSVSVYSNCCSLAPNVAGGDI